MEIKRYAGSKKDDIMVYGVLLIMYLLPFIADDASKKFTLYYCIGLTIFYVTIIFIGCFTTCYKWIMDEKGCTFAFYLRKKTYTWDELKTKWVITYFMEGKYEDCLFLSTHEMDHVSDLRLTSRNVTNYCINNPYTAFSMYFGDPKKMQQCGGGKESPWIADGVDKEEVYKNLESWGVEVKRVKWDSEKKE